MLIFIFQAIWFFIDELAGKGLDLIIVGKFLFYYSPNLIPNVLPLTVLLASIMTFGTFAENYEFAAMKSSGVSLYRAMRSLIIFMVILSIGTFFFANNVIPKAEHKSFNLRKNIAKLKPALAITEGVFNDVANLNIKVDDKYGENDRFLKNVVIHKKGNGSINTTVIYAKTGELISDEKSDFLQLVLKDGYYYEDVQTKSSKTRKRMPHAKAHFEQYVMNMDLSALNDVNLEEEKYSNLFKMQNVSQLKRSIDSLVVDNREIVTAFSKNISAKTGLGIVNKKEKEIKVDSMPKTNINLLSLVKETARKQQVIDVALNNINNVKGSLESRKPDLFRRSKLLNYHILTMHSKYALALACLVLFFVGAPLGAIIRKGGMGLPMVIAIALFLTYYFIGIFAGNNAKNGELDPVLASWISTLIMLPLGIMLTRRATADKGIFDIDGFTEPIRNLFKKAKNRTYKHQK